MDERHNMVEKPEETVNPVPFKKAEETIENPEEEETSETSKEEETSDSEQETEEKKPEVAEEKMVTQKELDKVYARMKTAEEAEKKAKEELAKKPSAPVSETDAILEVQQATKGLSPEEVAELQLRAKANKTSLSEAREDDNFKLWQDGMKVKVEKEKALNPSTTQSEVEKEEPKSIDKRLKEIKEKYKGDNEKIQEESEKVLAVLKFKDPITGRTVVGMNPVEKR